jgi:hypothetical protein
MNSNDPFIKRLIDINQPMEDNPCRFSTIALSLRGARKLSGRNLETGVYEKNEYNEQNFKENTVFSFQFLGLLSYLIFLEQIGSIFCNKNETRCNKAILYALKTFSSLSNDKAEAVFALRNSLAHKYGLATEKDRRLKFKFSILIEENTEIIKLPAKNWAGDFSDKSDETLTEIYTITLIDLIESIYTKIQEEIEKNNLEIQIEKDEIESRFTIIN